MYVCKEDRIQQVARWLKTAFPLPWEVDVGIVSSLRLGPDSNGNIAEKAYGAALVFSIEEAEIQLLRSVPLAWMLDTLFHEWAHLRRNIGHVGHDGCGKAGCVETHDDEFYLEYGRIDRRYSSEGDKLSRKY